MATVMVDGISPRRVLVVSESFLPQMNGATNSVCEILEHLSRTGHTARLVTPTGPSTYARAAVEVVRSIPLPMYATSGRAARHAVSWGRSSMPTRPFSG